MECNNNTIVLWSSLYDIINYRNENSPNSIIMFSMSSSKGYVLIDEDVSFRVLNPELCLCEMVLDNTARPFIDFDLDITSYIPKIESSIRSYFLSTFSENNINIRWKWSIYNLNLRWHCIISGVYFNRCWIVACVNMVNYVRNSVDTPLGIDTGIYRSNASLRLVGQYKYHEDKYIKKLYSYTPYNTREEENMLTIRQMPNDRPLEDNSKSHTSSIEDKTTSNLESLDNIVIPHGFTISEIKRSYTRGLYIRLNRVMTTYCPLCMKDHDNENAYLMIKDNQTYYGCFRRDKTLVTDTKYINITKR